MTFAALAWLIRECPEQASKLGWLTFQLGLLLLPSSALLAGALLFVSFLLGLFGRFAACWRDPWNWPLLLAALLMLLGCLVSYSGWLAWVGLGNLLPFFLGFWAFQPYLVSLTIHKATTTLLQLFLTVKMFRVLPTSPPLVQTLPKTMLFA